MGVGVTQNIGFVAVFTIAESGDLSWYGLGHSYLDFDFGNASVRCSRCSIQH